MLFYFNLFHINMITENRRLRNGDWFTLQVLD